MSRAWASGSSRRWRRIRAAVLARDGYRCKVQVPGRCTVDATCVHHVKGRAATGDDPAWLVASCDECNLTIGDPATRRPKPRKVTKW